MYQSNREREQLSRRDALKALVAATGAITLSNLPKQWARPTIEVGILPVHAQASPTSISLSNLSVGLFGTVNNCIGTGTGLVGTLHDTSFDFDDLNGGILPGTGVIIRQISRFSGNSETRDFTTGFTITGNGFTGTIFYSTCVHFGGSSDIKVEISIATPDGRTSNTLTTTLQAPPGAMGEEKNGNGSIMLDYKRL